MLTLSLEEELDPIKAALAEIKQLLKAAAQPADDYLSLDQVAALTSTSVRTVRKWIAEGKPDHAGRLIRLYTLEFSPGYVRIPRSALLAYGQGVGFDTSLLALPLTTPVLNSEHALRRAS